LTTEGAKVTTDEYITQMEAALAAHEADLPQIRRVAQTSVCDVYDMLIPLQAEVESLHACFCAILTASTIFITDGRRYVVGRRWGRTGFGIQDSGLKEQDSGVRSQESE